MEKEKGKQNAFQLHRDVAQRGTGPPMYTTVRALCPGTPCAREALLWLRCYSCEH